MRKCLLILGVILTAPVMGQELTREQEIIAMTILGEARGEGEAGMYAVGCLLKQRKQNSSGKLSYSQICLKKWQCSCWNPNDPNRSQLKKLLANSSAAKYAKRVALNIDKLQLSFIANADHYCAVNAKPYWTYKKVLTKEGKRVKVEIPPVKVIGNHKFYKLR